MGIKMRESLKRKYEAGIIVLRGGGKMASTESKL